MGRASGPEVGRGWFARYTPSEPRFPDVTRRTSQNMSLNLEIFTLTRRSGDSATPVSYFETFARPVCVMGQANGPEVGQAGTRGRPPFFSPWPVSPITILSQDSMENIRCNCNAGRYSYTLHRNPIGSVENGSKWARHHQSRPKTAVGCGLQPGPLARPVTQAAGKRDKPWLGLGLFGPRGRLSRVRPPFRVILWVPFEGKRCWGGRFCFYSKYLKNR